VDQGSHSWERQDLVPVYEDYLDLKYHEAQVTYLEMSTYKKAIANLHTPVASVSSSSMFGTNTPHPRCWSDAEVRPAQTSRHHDKPTCGHQGTAPWSIS
jgi:hypothetical protein